MNFIPNDLDWLAFRYVAAELSDADRIQFERRLDEDAAAREAVAQAVALTQAIAATKAASQLVTVGGQSHSRRLALRRTSWLALTLAVGLLIALAVTAFQTHYQTGVPSTANDLASLWSESRTELVPPANGDWPARETSDRELDLASAEDNEEFATPDWLLAAVVSYENQPETAQ